MSHLPTITTGDTCCHELYDTLSDLSASNEPVNDPYSSRWLDGALLGLFVVVSLLIGFGVIR